MGHIKDTVKNAIMRDILELDLHRADDLKIDAILSKHLEPQKKAEEGIESENIIYDYGFQADRLYEKHHPSDKKVEEGDDFERLKEHSRKCTTCNGHGWILSEPQQEDMGKLNDMLAKHYEQEDKKIEKAIMCGKEIIDIANLWRKQCEIIDHINTH